MQTLIEYIRALSLINTVCGAVLIVLAVLWIRVYWQEWKKKNSAEEREKANLLVLLQDICPVWVKDQDGKLVRIGKNGEGTPQVMVENLAPIWREPEVVEPEEEKLGKVDLQNKRAARFYKSLSRTNKKHLDVIARLLMLLDKEGGCSSVVSQQATQDPETSWDSNTYQKLGTITLLDHTLNVAEFVIAKLGEEQSNYMVPDAVVAALGHDIGKLPSKQAKLYAQGDHPLTSAEVIADIPGFNKLPKKDIILKLIKTHHKDSDEFLAKILKQADQKARQAEIEQANARIAAVQKAAAAPAQPIEKQDEAETVKQETPVYPPSNKQTSAKAAWNTQHDIYGIDDTKEKKWGAHQPKEQIPQLDISHWFDADLCLQEIKRHINVINGKIFQAFSVPTGTVYVQTGLIRDILMAQAQKAEVMEIAMRDKEESAEMRPVLLAAVNIFRRRNAIETNQVGEKYFGGSFAVHYRDGQKQKGYYTPFTAEAFLLPGESIGELEKRKKGRLMDITSVDIWKGEQAG